MPFPETRHTLIQRLATGGTEADWGAFLADYWGPVCRFVQFRGQASAQDADDVAAQVFQIVWSNGLLARWSAERTARLRTLLCAVARNILSNENRVQQGRTRLLRDNAAALIDTPGVPIVGADAVDPEHEDTFYAAWVGELLQQAVDALLLDYQAENRGDYFRTLYGRLCEQMTLPEIAVALGQKLPVIEKYNRHARERLREKLHEVTRAHVVRYSDPGEANADFQLEWNRLGEFLAQHGGLEDAVRQAYTQIDQTQRSLRQRELLQ